jgi:hypothetical protein
MFSASASAQAPASGTSSPASKATVTKPKTGAAKRVSPYARAAAQRERAGQAPAGHAPTMVQAIGKPRKPHAGAPAK